MARTNEITETKLVGDFLHSGIQMPTEKAKEFLTKLETLMTQYEIERIDICWAHFKETHNNSPVHVG